MPAITHASSGYKIQRRDQAKGRENDRRKKENKGRKERGEVTVRRKKRRRRNGTAKKKNRGSNRRRGSSVGGTALPHCHLRLQRRSHHCEPTRAAAPPRSQCRGEEKGRRQQKKKTGETRGGEMEKA
jgi:hypothetical protein